MRGKQQWEGTKCVFGFDSDAKKRRLRYTTKQPAGEETGTNEQNSKAKPSWDVREEGRPKDRLSKVRVEAEITIATKWQSLKVSTK